jgi:hypothetical protein
VSGGLDGEVASKLSHVLEEGVVYTSGQPNAAFGLMQGDFLKETEAVAAPRKRYYQRAELS